MKYKIYGRYFGGEKFKAEVTDCMSAPAAISLAMAEVPNIRVALTLAKRGKEDDKDSD